jgi:hypothetical protein
VYIGGETSQELFAASKIATGPGGIPIRVPKPEHLSALKITAMKNDPARTLQDMADVRFLLHMPGVDRSLIRNYFDRQGMRDKFDDIDKA